jgi:predicted nucleic acid-binding protein
LKIDLQGSLRRLKPEKKTGHLARRPDTELTFVGPGDATGSSVLLDTTVYLDVLNGITPPEVDALLATRPLFHVSVVISELTNWFGKLDPKAADTAAALKELTGTINEIPIHRVEAVTPGTMLEAGIMSGLVHRMGGFQPHQTLHAINDAAIYLHAIENGHTVLTRNIRDFDFMQQILPAGRVLFYRA